MRQVSVNPQREEKLEQRNTVHEDKESVMKMSQSETNKGFGDATQNSSHKTAAKETEQR